MNALSLFLIAAASSLADSVTDGAKIVGKRAARKAAKEAAAKAAAKSFDLANLPLTIVLPMVLVVIIGYAAITGKLNNLLPAMTAMATEYNKAYEEDSDDEEEEMPKWSSKAESPKKKDK